VQKQSTCLLIVEIGWQDQIFAKSNPPWTQSLPPSALPFTIPSMAAPKGMKHIYNPSTGELFLPNPSKAMQCVQDLRKKIEHLPMAKIVHSGCLLTI